MLAEEKRFERRDTDAASLDLSFVRCPIHRLQSVSYRLAGRGAGDSCPYGHAMGDLRTTLQAGPAGNHSFWVTQVLTQKQSRRWRTLRRGGDSLKQREHANRRTQAGRTSWMRKPAAMRPGTPRLSLVIFNPALIPEPACALFLDFAQPTPPLWSIQPFQSVQPLAF